jgi:hypothetical protein
MQALPPAEASEQLIQKTVRSIEAGAVRRQQRWRYYSRSVFWAAAAAVLIIGSLHAYYFRMQPSPYDVRLLGQSQLLSGSHAALRVAVWDRRPIDRWPAFPCGSVCSTRASGRKSNWPT